MTKSGLTLFDMVTLGLILFSGVVGYLRGLLREVFSAGAFVAAALATVFGYPFLKDVAHKAVSPDWFGDMIVVGGIFLIVYVAVRILASQVATSIRDGFQIGALDRSMGFGFGLLRGLLIMALGLIVFQAATPVDRMPKWLTGARSYPLVNSTAGMLKSLAPEGAAAKLTAEDTVEIPADDTPTAPKPKTRAKLSIEKSDRVPADDIRSDGKPAPTAKPAPTPAKTAPAEPKNEETYDSRDRRSLDQLISTTTE